MALNKALENIASNGRKPPPLAKDAAQSEQPLGVWKLLAGTSPSSRMGSLADERV